MDSSHVEISAFALRKGTVGVGRGYNQRLLVQCLSWVWKCFLFCQIIRNMWTNITINAITLNNPLYFASVFIKHYSLCLRWIIVKVNILTRPLIKLYGAIHLLAPHFHPLWNRIIFITVHLVATVCCCYCGEMGHNKVHSAMKRILITDRIQNALPTNA